VTDSTGVTSVAKWKPGCVGPKQGPGENSPAGNVIPAIQATASRCTQPSRLTAQTSLLLLLLLLLPLPTATTTTTTTTATTITIGKVDRRTSHEGPEGQ